MINIVGGLRMLKSNILMNLISILLIAIDICAICFTISLTMLFNEDIRYLSPLENKKGIYFYADKPQDLDLLESLDDAEIFHCKSYSASDTESLLSITAIFYNESLAQNTMPSIKKGKWESTDVNSDIFNVAVSQDINRNIGDIFEIALTSQDKTLKVRVSAILHSGSKYLTFNSSNSTASGLFLNNSCEKVIILCDNTLSYSPNGIYSSIILFDDKISSSDFDNNLSILSEQSSTCMTLSSLLANSIAERNGWLTLILPLIISFGILSLLSMSVVLAITYKKNKKLLTIIYYSGGSLKEISTVVLCYFIALFLIISLVTTIFYSLVGIITDASMATSLPALLGSLGCLGFIFCITSLVYGKIIYKNSVNYSIRSL